MQGEENDSPLSRRTQALIRMQHYICNSVYLIKKHTSSLQLTAAQEEPKNLREAIGTGVCQLDN